jgi:hypothetical protein
MNDPYAEMVEQAHQNGHLWVVWSDGLVTNGRTRPTREELIQDAMSIPVYVCGRDASGAAVMTGPEFWTREKAEFSIGDYGIEREERAA